MTSEEIRDIAIDSAQAYYTYLEKNNKGVQEVGIFEISYPPSRDLILRLTLSQKLFDTEAIFFRNLRNNTKYDADSVKVIEYDNDKNILLIKPKENISSHFRNLSTSDLKVLSDLKFLVQRVKTWYELNGASVQIPKNESKYKDAPNKVQYISERGYQPSENQEASIKNIFTNPFSYIWGAPGTGKTQFVLSYAVLHYVNNRDRIAILGPTNNAIEQVLRGVLKMTDKAGVDRKQIIRLGTPSKKFAEEYPEVCEEKGVQKRLMEIDQQISVIERVLAYEEAVTKLREFSDGLQLFENVLESNVSIIACKADLEEKLSKWKRKEIDVNYEIAELEQLRRSREKEVRKANSFGFKIMKAFTSKETSPEKKMRVLDSEIKSKSKEIDYLKHELVELDNLVAEKKSQLSEYAAYGSRCIAKIKQLFEGDVRTAPITKDLTLNNALEKKIEMASAVESIREKVEVSSHLHDQYKQTPLEHVRDSLERHLSARSKLAALSTEERIKTVNVIASTLDGYIGRYSESKLNVSHIFLDEAGYANIIKALTLFNHDIPITFLGDHKQLPPVCEINDSDIKGDDNFRNMFIWAQSAIRLNELFHDSRDVCLDRYLKNGEVVTTGIAKTSLTATYRFGNNLARILAHHVYGGDFRSSNPKGQTQIHFIHAHKQEGLKSRISMNEVQVIMKLVDNLKRSKQSDFIVLTPYKKQVSLLNSYLPQERNELKILTVHGSQGREWDTVILSVVDTVDRWFVDSTLTMSKGLNLVNTAVSRAKSELIIVCDKNYWLNQNGQLITDLIRNGVERH